MADNRAIYVDRDNETVYRPPYLQANTFLTSWILPSPKSAQQAILDAHLNACSGGQPYEYRALISKAMLVFANISQVSSLDPRDQERGWIPEIDICTWLLAGAYKMVNGKRELDHLVWYVPYIWVNNAYTMATGREAFGYPKALGFAQLPKDPNDPGPLWADALVLPTFTPTTEVVRKRIFDLARDTSVKVESAPKVFGADGKRDAFFEIAKKLHEVGEADCDWELFVKSFEELLGEHLPMVFLKQFRDATDPKAACYQAIVEANATITDFKGAGFLLPGWDLKMNSYASVDIPGHLGFAPQQRIDLGFYVYFSFSMDLGTEVWRYGGTP